MRSSRLGWAREPQRWNSLHSFQPTGLLFNFPYEAVECAVGKAVHPHDLTAGIDSEGEGLRGTRDIDSGEGALVQQKAVRAAAGIEVVAHHLTRGIDPGGYGPRGTRDINGGEAALVQQKAM